MLASYKPGRVFGVAEKIVVCLRRAVGRSDSPPNNPKPWAPETRAYSSTRPLIGAKTPASAGERPRDLWTR